MTWAEFIVKVKDLMPVESVRQNTQTYLTALIRQAAVDLQRHILFYREGQQTFYTDEDVVTTSLASVGNLPNQAHIIDIFLKGVGYNCCRTPVMNYPWGNRHDLWCGHPNLTTSPCIAIDPYAKEFTLFPALDADNELEVNWDGLKIDFDDDDEVTFDEPAALPVSSYALAHIYRKVRNDMEKYGSFMLDYRKQRTDLIIDKKGLTRIRETGASPQPDSACAECECYDEMNA